MDWRRIVAEVARVGSLEAQAARAHLLDLNTTEPDLATEVIRLARWDESAGTFMRTAAPDAASQRQPALSAGDRIGVWRIDEPIGAGGMGEVYRASRADGLYDQTVAVKVIQGQISADRTAAFERERQRLARLDHPGVSRIIDGGATPDGRPYMAMEFVQGSPIDVYCANKDLNQRARVHLLAELCDAVSHAHARLVLHRDIKASNVLVTPDGQVKLVDFGVASLLNESETDQIGPMTLATAAPEQLFGQPLSAATDVFGLGVLAYALLSGKTPERTEYGGVDLKTQALQNRDLASITDRATALKPGDRYASADALVEDLRAFLAHRPVAARRGDRLYLVRTFLRRYPVGSALAATAVAALIGGLATSLTFSYRANENLKRAEFFLEEAEFNDRLQDAWADALLRMFGNDADVERQTELLLDHWREAYATRDAEPENAAIVSLAIGNHFAVRHDDVTAREILQPLIEEGFGSDRTLQHAKLVAGYVYASLGETDKSNQLLRETVAYYSQGYHAFSYDHASTASWLAYSTEDADDIENAIHVNREFLKASDSNETTLTVMNYLGTMYEKQGKQIEAYKIAQDVYDFYNENKSSATTEQGAVEIKLARFELYYTRDLERADTLIGELLQRGSQEFGLNRQTGRALTFAGDLALARGNAKEAQAKLRESLPILERFVGRDHPYYFAAGYSLVEALAIGGELGEAQNWLNTLDAAVPAHDSSGTIDVRSALARTLVLLHSSGPDDAADFLRGAELDLSVLDRAPECASRYNDLMEAGIAPSR